MKKTLLMIGLGMSTLVTIPFVFSDEDMDEYRQRSQGVAAVSNTVYKEECGSCHMAYPPGLLPGTSWQEMMNGLDDHFGDNAELESSVKQEITEFLLANSADTSDYRRSRKFMNSIETGKAPIRISETRYFRHEHDEIPARMVKGNDKVKSFSNCNACHAKAEQGMFDEHGVRIPGYGRWDD